MRILPLTTLCALAAGAATAAPPALQPAPGALEYRVAGGGRPVEAAEVPAPLLAKVRAALAARLAAAGVTDSPVLAGIEQVTWPDGSLGCGRPGEVHTALPVAGYRFVYTAGTARYEYHASDAGLVLACGNGAHLPVHAPPPPGEPVPPGPVRNPSE